MATNTQLQETPEYRIFREHYDRLVTAILDPLLLATRLFARNIIDSTVKEQMSVLGLSRVYKNNVLLGAVEMQIRTNKRMFGVFLSALNDPSMQSLVESMQGGLLSTTSGAHGGGSVDSSDDGEELSTPAVKRKCLGVENSVSLVSSLGGGESVTLPRVVTYPHPPHHHPPDHHHPQHHIEHLVQHSNSQPPLQTLYHPPFHPYTQVVHPPPHQHEPPVQSLTCQPSHCPPFQPPPVQPSYQHTEPIQLSYYHPSHHSSNPPSLQHSTQPTGETPHQQPHYQLHQKHVYTYQPPYQHPFSHLSLGNHTYRHLGYHEPPTFQAFQLPPLQLHQIPSLPFHQTSFQAPVQLQPVNSYQSSPSQHPPHPDSPLGKYAQFLRGYYTQHHAPCTKWPQLHTRKYINLAVINNVYANRADLVQFRKQTIHGCIDDILEWKAPIEMKTILKPNQIKEYDRKLCEEKNKEYPVTQLLIEGAPGIGKSTFAWEVCQNWGQHQLFTEYSLVVLLKFRDKRVQEAKTVSDLFHYPLPELQSDIVQDIVLSGGRGLLLILEGFDEAPASKRTMDSIIVKLFRGQELPQATVILTTRPSANPGLRQLCNSVNSRRIEIVGFGKKEIDEYIQCAFSDERSRSDFNEYLSLYPHIHSMMYVPLNSAIVTHVYESCKSSGAVVPKTMTQLYSSLIRTLLLRYLKDKEEYKDTCTTINSFNDLPQPVYDQFCEICKIAYKGIMHAETELIFQDLPSNFDSQGLMQTCPELYVDRGASVSYNFLHLTIQEYLAAYHISQKSRDEQVAFMRACFGSEKMEVVVRFLAGLSELGRDLWDVVRWFASGAKPSGSFIDEKTNFIKLKILHWLFESQEPSAITSVLGSDCVCFSHDSGNTFGLYVLGYCITHSSCYWKLELENCKLESVGLFLRALNFQQDQCQLSSTGQIKGVWLKLSNPAVVHFLVDSMPQMSKFHNLTHLSLMTCGLGSETCNHLSKHTDLLLHLEYLNLNGNHIGRGGAVNLITSLTKFSTIRELDLHYTGIGFEDCKALSELLASSTNIKVLDICSHGQLSSDSAHLIVDGLSHNTSLEKLDMSGSNFSSQNVFKLSSVLRVNTRLKVLNIGWCSIQSSDSVHLAKALEENTTTQLHTLCLKGNPIRSEGPVAFASMLKKNQCLKTLDLNDDGVGVGVEGALELIESLKHNTTLEKLVLSGKCKPPSFSTLDKTLQNRVTFRSYCSRVTH